MKAGAYFAVATAALIGIGYFLLQLSFKSPAEHRAIQISALLALAVQIATFVIGRKASKNMMVGWGIGTLVRVLAVVLYAFIVAPAYALPMTAALISLVIFLFVSMLVEPLLLAYDR
jgi:hypothetical protein